MAVDAIMPRDYRCYLLRSADDYESLRLFLMMRVYRCRRHAGCLIFIPFYAASRAEFAAASMRTSRARCR